MANQLGFLARRKAEPDLQTCFPARGRATATPRPHVASQLGGGGAERVCEFFRL